MAVLVGSPLPLQEGLEVIQSQNILEQVLDLLIGVVQNLPIRAMHLQGSSVLFR